MSDDTNTSNIVTSCSSSDDSKINQPRLRILCLGASLTEGFTAGGTKFTPYADYIRKQQQQQQKQHQRNKDDDDDDDDDVVVDGVSGCTTYDMYNRLSYRLKNNNNNKKSTFDCIIILGGTNNIGSGESSDCVFKSIIKIYELAKTKIPLTLILTLPETSFSSSSSSSSSSSRAGGAAGGGGGGGGDEFELNRRLLNEKLIKYAQDLNDKGQHDISVLDISSLLPYGSGSLYCDSIHFTTKGYLEMGKIIYKHLREKGWIKQ